MVTFKRGRLLASAVLACIPANATFASDTWTGAAGTDWANGHNWSTGSGPGPNDTVLFTDTGSSILPGDVTSVVNADRTIGGLAFIDTSGHYHTLDLGGYTLTDNGILAFNLDQPKGTTLTLRGGTLAMNGGFGNLSVGQAVSGNAQAMADLSGLTAIKVNVQSVMVGTSTAGTATGTLTLSPGNTITAQLIAVGSSNNSQDTTGTLHLGLSNTILAGEFDIGKDNSHGTVDIANGGTLNLGDATHRTVLQIANQNTNTNGTYTGVMNLGNATVNLHLDSLVVAEKNGGPGNVSGQLVGGVAGSVYIGDQQTRGNVYVGYTVKGGSTQATADFSQLGTFKAYVSDFVIAEAPTGSSQATVSLAANSTIDAAHQVIVGASGNASLNLGQTNAILTPRLVVGQDYSISQITVAGNGSLNLGSPSQRTDVFIGNGNTNTNSTYGGTVDLGAATFNGYLGQLIVGQKDGGPGAETARFAAGGGGSIDIGAPGNTANFYVGRVINGGAATGTVDFGGLSSLRANLNNFGIATAATGKATGTVSLAQSNTISANNILVGDDGDATLTLGRSNTILTPQFTIGMNYSGSIVKIVPGGTLTLGSPAQPTMLQIGIATNTNTNDTFSGTLDLSNGTLVAYLDGVVLGTKNPLPGGERGTLTLSDHPDNYIQVNTIAVGQTAQGVLNFGGGTLVANAITAPAGQGTFNWTGGRLSVGSFGSAAASFDLNNTGAGVLAPGSAAAPVGTSIIYGNYMQGSAASLALDLSGAAPGAGSDLVRVTKLADLSGTLSLNALAGFAPSVGQTWPLMAFAGHTGSFSFVVPPRMPSDVAFQLNYTPTGLAMQTVAPVAQKWVGTSGSFSTASNWDTGNALGTASSLSISNAGSSPQTVSVASPTTVHRIDLDGASAPVSLLVPQGVSLGVANQIVIGTNATLAGAGQIYGEVSVGPTGTLHLGGATLTGDVSVAPGGITQFSGEQPSQLTGGITGDGQVNVDASSTLSLAGFNLNAKAPGNASLNIGSSATVHLAHGGGPSQIGSLTIGSGGVLDLADNSLDIHFASNPDPSATIAAYITTAYHGGSWIGSGIRSAGLDANHALGMAHVSGGDLLVGPALFGDTNLDGSVNFTDLLALAQHYGQANATWEQGDFNYDASVGFDDLLTLAQHYGQSPTVGQLASLTPAFRADVERAFAQVPEPASGALLLGAAAVLLPRRPRRRGA